MIKLFVVWSFEALQFGRRFLICKAYRLGRTPWFTWIHKIVQPHTTPFSSSRHPRAIPSCSSLSGKPGASLPVNENLRVSMGRCRKERKYAETFLTDPGKHPPGTLHSTNLPHLLVEKYCHTRPLRRTLKK